jgi:uncharacterized protein YbjT (DUF2867 family)
MARRALLLGGTGLVGGELLRLLLAEPGYESVTALVRRPLPIVPPRLHAVVVDFDKPEALRASAASDDVFCCLGTTIKQAGSQAAFRKVDFDYPLACARAALEAGAGQFLVVTAVGASAKSSIFYNRVKGELEEALRALPFPRGVKVFHPSILVGERKEHRLGEGAATLVMRATAPLFAGPLQKYRAIEASAVARAMVKAALHEPPGTQVYEGKRLFELGR